MNRRNIFSCKCGFIVEALNCSSDNICKELTLLKENSVEASVEKHIPVIKKIEGGYRVIVGEVEHPMSSEHYIQCIELNEENMCHIRFLRHEDSPEAIFKTDAKEVSARSYCNLHGLWKS